MKFAQLQAICAKRIAALITSAEDILWQQIDGSAKPFFSRPGASQKVPKRIARNSLSRLFSTSLGILTVVLATLRPISVNVSETVFVLFSVLARAAYAPSWHGRGTTFLAWRLVVSLFATNSHSVLF